MEVQSDGVDSEQFSDAFLCCICLDLLYKPVVLACGHISCFWCVHRSMSGLRESRCPICRHPYRHFPTICEMLHLLLLKMYPVACRRRETQMLEEEKVQGCFSPQFDALLHASSAKAEQNCQYNDQPVPGENSLDSLSTGLCCTGKSGPFDDMERLRTTSEDFGRNISKQISSEATCSVAVDDKKLHQKSWREPFRQILITDVLCYTCKQLLVQPVVLNCGHVYCASCIVVPTGEDLRCQACQGLHPSGSVKVCLELDQLVKEQFPKEYELRKGTVLLEQVNCPYENPSTCSSEKGKQDDLLLFPTGEDVLPWWGNHGLNVHIGAGCDFCGMYPIIGDRYKCTDCKEEIGFDLCGDCYNTRSKRPGRFNQQHTSEHRFMMVKSNSLHNIMLRLLRGRVPDGSPTIPPNDSSTTTITFGSPENTLDSWINNNGGEEEEEEDTVNGLAVTAPFPEEEEDRDGTLPPPF